MYKVVTASPLLDTTILHLLGQDPDRALDDARVRWVYREEWKHAFPEYDGGTMLDDIELADGIFYTGVGEEVVSSLEMSCRIGRRAADLLIMRSLHRRLSHETNQCDLGRNGF